MKNIESTKSLHVGKSRVSEKKRYFSLFTSSSSSFPEATGDKSGPLKIAISLRREGKEGGRFLGRRFRSLAKEGGAKVRLNFHGPTRATLGLFVLLNSSAIP